MRQRDDVLVYKETQASDKTSKTWDLKYTDPLSALYLEFWAVNGSTSNKGNFISDIITNVEIVDGSKPLFQLTQAELEALNFYKTKRAPVLFPSEHPSGTQRHGVNLLFGRKLWDPQFAFDCTKYSNPQLKITWDLGAVRTVSATTAFTTGSLQISAIAKLMNGISAPPSFLSAREVDLFTMPTSGSHLTQMYTDYPWRMMMLRSFIQGSDIDECIDHITLNCDAGSFKPIDNRYMRDLDAEALAEFGRCQFKHDIFTQNLAAFREINNKENSGHWADFAKTIPSIIGINYEWSSEGKLDMYDNAAAAISADEALTGFEDGHAPHATVPVPFGDLGDPSSWFDATAFKRIDLTLYAPSSGHAGVSSVVLEQVRPNGQ